jgi:hypothetical protein
VLGHVGAEYQFDELLFGGVSLPEVFDGLEEVQVFVFFQDFEKFGDVHLLEQTFRLIHTGQVALRFHLPQSVQPF